MMIIFNVFQTSGYFGFANRLPTFPIKQGVTVATNLGYTTPIMLAAPVRLLPGLLIGDRFERNLVIVWMAALNQVCGLLASSVVIFSILGVLLTLARNVISYSDHAYQQELFPTGIRTRAAYSCSSLSAVFNAFLIAFILENFGTLGVFVFIGCAMTVVIPAIGVMGPRTRLLELEKISH